MRSFSLRIKLMGLMLLAFLPLVVLEVNTAQEQERRAAENARTEALRLSRLCAGNQRELMDSVRQLLTVISKLEEVQHQYNGECVVLFETLLRENPFFAVVGAADLEGNVYCTAPKGEGTVNVKDRAYFQRAIQTRRFSVGDYVISRRAGRATIHMAQPVINDQGQVTGVVYVGLDLMAISNFGTRVPLSPGASIAMLDEKNVTLLRYPNPERWVGRHAARDLAAGTLQSGASEATLEATGIDGQPRIYAVQRIEAPGIGNLFMMVGISKKEAYAPYRQQMRAQMAMMAGTAFLALAAAWLLGRYGIVRPARHLAGVARLLSAGRLDVRSTLRGGEFGEIATAFNQMAEALSRRIAELDSAQRELRQAHDELELHVTERTEELRHAQEHLVDAIENLDAGFVMFGPDERLVICNQTFRTMFALCADLIVPGVTFDEIFHEFVARGGRMDGVEDMDQWLRDRLAMFHEASSREFDQKMNGRWVRVSDHRMRDGGIVSLRTDVTNLKEIQETLILRDRAIAAAVSGIVVTDPTQPDNPIVDVNPAFVRITGYTKEDAVGKNCRFLQGSGTDPEALTAIRGSITAAREGQAVLRNYRKDGTAFWNEIKITPVRDASGRLIHFVGVLTDVSARVEAQEALQRVLDELHRSNQELEQFAYMVSHDLQEPLRMVASYTQLLARRYKDRLEGDALEFINYAVDGAQRMQKFIQDLLQYSRVGTHGRPFERVRVADVVRRALDNLHFSIEEKKAEVTCGDMPELDADSVQLGQLFQNLVGNALKFSGEGPLRISIEALRREEQWEFVVRDNGIGIDPADAERIFIIFQRLHTRQEYEGTGLGLAICKRIVERHRGRIWVESQVGQGAAFHFMIPERHEERPLPG
ncbi:MAG: ATP-binding protein [Chthoniobacteraceae bacterium]|nr:ATP-binding protein [Chthoniobacteraceae bacterium]